MIKYHGTPFGGSKSEATEALIGRHAFISFYAPAQLDVALDVCQSVAFDNGAFSAWKSGVEIDWDKYFDWVAEYRYHPRFDWAIIPDVIDGDEEANYKLIARWTQRFGRDAVTIGVPVWHMHESADKLEYLALSYQRIAIGSSADYATVGSPIWHKRMQWAMKRICRDGKPITKIHMLRGLDPEVFSEYPFSSADSTNAARNCTLEQAWKGTYAPPSNSWRARVLMARIEAYNSSAVFAERQTTADLFEDAI